MNLRPTHLSPESTIIESVSIIVRPAACELEIQVTHTKEETRDEQGQPFELAARTFRSRVACPYSAADAMARETASRYPNARLEVSFA